MEVGDVSSSANCGDQLNQLVEEVERELNLVKQVADAERSTESESASTTPTNSVEPNSTAVLNTQLRTIEDSASHHMKTVYRNGKHSDDLQGYTMEERRLTWDRSEISQLDSLLQTSHNKPGINLTDRPAAVAITDHLKKSMLLDRKKCEQILHDVRKDLRHLSGNGRPHFEPSNLESDIQTTLSQNIQCVDGYLKVISSLDSRINEFMTHSSLEEWDEYTTAQVRRQLDELWCLFHDRLAVFSGMEQLEVPATDDKISTIILRDPSGNIRSFLQELISKIGNVKKQLFSQLNFLNGWKYSDVRSLLPVFTSELALLRSLISLHALLTNLHEVVSSTTTPQYNFLQTVDQSSCSFSTPVSGIQLEENHNENGTTNEEEDTIRETMMQLNELIAQTCKEFQPVQDAEPHNTHLRIPPTQCTQSSSTALHILVCSMDDRLVNAYRSALTETAMNVRRIPCVLKELCNQLHGIRMQMERATEVHIEPPKAKSSFTKLEMPYECEVTSQDLVKDLLDSYQNYLSLIRKHYEVPFRSFDELVPRLESHKVLFTGLAWYSTKVECVSSLLLCNVAERSNHLRHNPIWMTDHRLRHRMRHLCQLGKTLKRQLITWFGDVFSLRNRWNRLEQQIEEINGLYCFLYI
ncbi:hypothetical protein P879_00243 [Paragonimus westermani]|uniref:Uncharacterized protein n=1 Tax=Paragonimus westermani TaxID=34504 RepID=A0A8T0DTF6_9TREM|nr:hypothetical protein P879_00243 [Paragonimus westermani]